MNLKLPVVGFALVTALSGTALAHEPHHSNNRPAGYGPAGYGPAGYGPASSGPKGHGGYDRHGGHGGYGSGTAVDLRYSDLNRDGWVTVQEALDSGRQVFHRTDRDGNRMLTRRELSRPALAQGDRNNDGRVSLREHDRAVRAQFASYDRNRDGYLARHELGQQSLRGSRSAGWWR